MKRLAKLYLVIILILSFTLSPLLAKPASAQWVVFDPANFTNTTLQTPVKEFGIDSVAWILANMVLERIAASTVNWINNGFKGSPAFITDPDRYFKNLADGIAGQVIYNHPDLKFMCAPFKLQVQMALARTYSAPPRQFQCTLTGVVGNWDNFMNDFSSGGWDGFLEVTQKNENNPVGLYLNLSGELSDSIANATNKKKDELNWGKGFFSKTKCEISKTITDTDEEGNVVESSVCLKETTETPGTVIEDKLNQALGTGQNRLEVADEISEIISALLNQLMSKALGGLRGLSKGSNGEQSYTQQLSQATANQQQLLSVPAENGQCPESYTLDTTSEPHMCYSTSRVQTTISNAQNTINQANNFQNCLIQAAGASGGTTVDANLLAQCSSQFGSGTGTGSGSGTGVVVVSGPVGSITGPTGGQYTDANTTGCGSLSTSYSSGTNWPAGNFCYNATLLQPISSLQFPRYTSNNITTWTCGKTDGRAVTQNTCSATYNNFSSCGSLATVFSSAAAASTAWSSGSFCSSGATVSGTPIAPQGPGYSVSWTCQDGRATSACGASVATFITTSTGGTGSTYFGTGGLGGTGTSGTGTGGTGTGGTGTGGTGNPYTVIGTDGGSHNLGSTAMAGACGLAAGSYTADWNGGFYGDLCGTGAQLNGSAPQFPEPGGSALWFCNGIFNGTPRTFDCTATRAAE
jgi:hypothetical protein